MHFFSSSTFAFKLPLFSIIIIISLEKSLLFPTGKFTVENFSYLYHFNFVACATNVVGVAVAVAVAIAAACDGYESRLQQQNSNYHGFIALCEKLNPDYDKSY